jgi:hypothetical protein
MTTTRKLREVTWQTPVGILCSTWSWASINGDISWYHTKVQYKWLATIIDVQVDLADTEYPFPQVSGATLRLQGPVQTAYILKEDNTGDRNNARMAGTKFRLPSGGNLTIYQDTTCPCQVPCGVCKGGMTSSRLENMRQQRILDFYGRAMYMLELDLL